MTEQGMARALPGRTFAHVESAARGCALRRSPTFAVVALVVVALAIAACGSSAGTPVGSSAGAPVGSPAVSTAAVAAMPPGYVIHKGPGFSIGLSSDWQIEAPGSGITLRATNTLGGHNWLLLLAREADEKPASQTFDDYAATQCASCDPGTVPDTLVVPAGSVYVCHAASSSLGLDVLDYRLPVGGDVWHLTLSFQDAVYSGAGQEEAETILGTLVLSAASAAEPNSLTSDDTKIMSEIKDGWTEVGAILDRTTTGADLSEMVDAFGELRDFARLEQTRIDAYAPSGCTERAADLYKRAMVLTESAASDFLAMVASGTAPSTSSDFSEAGGTLGDALNAVNASSCH